jgi:putative lipase involved disintegration of autophagic bodies
MGYKDNIQCITNEVAAKYAIYAMLSSNCYHKEDRVRFPVEKIGWFQVDLDGNRTSEPTKAHPLSKLAYDIYEKEGTNEVIFAFRGTDDKIDYLTANLAIPPFNFQYRQARKEFGVYLGSHGSKNISVTGHSLGGGLALCVSVHHGVKAVTFDPSPRIFDGMGDFHEPAERVIFYEDGEILEKVRDVWKKDDEVVETKNIYKCKYHFPEDMSKHRSDYLALGILGQGADFDKKLKLVLDAPPMKP